jgi:3-hydroxyisobutyrate dehydrogenase
MIAFFGTGMLGSGFVRAFRRRGEDVHIWNRTISKARALEAVGARVFEDPADAARGAARIHLSLSDDEVVDSVLERAQPTRGTTIVDHSTTSASGIAGRIAYWDARGVTFVHAPVFMNGKNALESTGLMLVSGDPARIDPLRPALAAMTGRLVDLGPRPEAAAAFKLLGNCFLMFLTSGLAELLMLAKATGIAPGDAATLFEYFNPGATIGARLKRMLDAKHEPPSWELAMARKDARIILDEATRAGCAFSVLPAIAQRMDEVIAEGFGTHDWTVLAKDALSSSR